MTISTTPAWWIVVIPGEYPETSDAYGPFRTESAADAVAGQWNATQSGPDPEKAFVLPVQHPKAM